MSLNCCSCDRSEGRRIFTADEVRRVNEFYREFLKTFGRAPTVAERRCMLGV